MNKIKSNVKMYLYPIFIVVLFLALINKSFSQSIPEHITNSGIYDFLNEMANEKIITINSAIKPYSKQFIFSSLITVNNSNSLLNTRQKMELAFYLKEFQMWGNISSNPYISEKVNILKSYSKHSAITFSQLGYFYIDSVFRVSVKPIYGYNYSTNDSGTVTLHTGGVRAAATIGKHLSFWGSLRDNYISQILSSPGYLTQQEGGNYKLNEGDRTGADYSEMRGGIAFSWKWGSISLSKDHIQWGDNFHGSNIFSSRTPSFAMIKLYLNPTKWFEFNYFHGWLVSGVIDSSASYFTKYGEYRAVFRPKYIAANMYTFHPWSSISISGGNSIVYSDLSSAHPAYLVPFLFYKSVDHTLNSQIQNQNSQLFFDINIRNIKHLQFYGSLFIDEFSLSRISDDTRHNFLSWKGGVQLSNFPIKNVSLIYEYTKSYPLVYKHRVEATEFTTNSYNLGNYLSDNSIENYFSLRLKLVQRLHLKLSYWFAWHANEYEYNIRGTIREDELPIFKDKTWSNRTLKLSLSYEMLNNVYVCLQYADSYIEAFDVDGKTSQYYLNKFTPEFYQGHQKTLSFNLNIGF